MSSPQRLKYLHTLTQMSHLMLTKLRTVFQFQQHIIHNLVQFLQLVCFLSCLISSVMDSGVEYLLKNFVITCLRTI